MSARLNVHDTTKLNAVFEGVVDALIAAASEYFEEKSGVNVGVSDKLRLSMAKKAFDLSKKFNSETKILKMVEIGNKVAPMIGHYLDEEAILAHLPEHLRGKDVIDLFERAGADEISALLRGLPHDHDTVKEKTPVVIVTPVARPARSAAPPPGPHAPPERPAKIPSTVGKYNLMSKKLNSPEP